MERFETGKAYTARNVMNHDDTFAIKVVKRTDKTLTFIYEGKQRKGRITIVNDEEIVRVGNYSMAPVFRAGRSIILN